MAWGGGRVGAGAGEGGGWAHCTTHLELMFVITMVPKINGS